MSEQAEYFTVVFRGDVRKLGFNPMKAETAFGEVVGISVGDCLTELWGIENLDSTQNEAHPNLTGTAQSDISD